MASFSLEVEDSVYRDLKKVAPAFVAIIIQRIAALAEDPFPRQSRKLTGREAVYRLRIGDYRILYKVDTDAHIVTILYVRHRRDACWSF